jgi:hypothetical protein
MHQSSISLHTVLPQLEDLRLSPLSPTHLVK